MINNYKAIVDSELTKKSKHGHDRYVIVDIETGEILDDAQGYGYKSKEGAYKCFGYKRKRADLN